MIGIHCDNCPNGKGKTEKELEQTCCDGLFNKIDCFQAFLYDKKLIYVSNESSRIAINEAIFNILRKYSTDKKESDGDDMNIPKPCDIAGIIIKERIANKQTKAKVKKDGSRI